MGCGIIYFVVGQGWKDGGTTMFFVNYLKIKF